MSRIDARIGALQRDFVSAAAAYAPLADEPEEARVWGALQKEVNDVQPLVDDMLALSRENRDTEARLALGPVDEHYMRLIDNVGRLATLNRVGVTRTLAALDNAQKRAQPPRRRVGHLRHRRSRCSSAAAP